MVIYPHHTDLLRQFVSMFKWQYTSNSLGVFSKKYFIISNYHYVLKTGLKFMIVFISHMRFYKLLAIFPCFSSSGIKSNILWTFKNKFAMIHIMNFSKEPFTETNARNSFYIMVCYVATRTSSSNSLFLLCLKSRTISAWLYASFQIHNELVVFSFNKSLSHTFYALRILLCKGEGYVAHN